MVRGVVPKKVARFLPTRFLNFECLLQIVEEGDCNIGIGIGMRQREPHSALSVQRCDHRQPGSHSIELHVAKPIPRRLCLADEAGFIEPSLVNVDDPGLGFQERQHS